MDKDLGDFRSGTPEGIMPVPLNHLRPGEAGVIQGLEGGKQVVSHLAALGFIPGARVAMLRNFGHGPLIVSIRDARIALGRGEAAKITVRKERVGIESAEG